MCKGETCVNRSSWDKTIKMGATYCNPTSPKPTSAVSSGATTVDPMRANCKNVLYLLMVVGRTSADGREKSQYRMKVLGGGRDIHR